MTAPTSGIVRLAEDTRRRFLTEIARRVPIERIVEVHLFSPIRQSGVETGVAIVAAERVIELPLGGDASDPSALGAPAVDQPSGDGPPHADAPDDRAPGNAGDADAIVVEDVDAIACDPTEDAASDAVVASGMESDAEQGTALAADDATPVDPMSDDETPPPVVDLAAALEPLDESVAAEAEPEPDDEPAEPAPPPVRHTVFMARYRLTIKGPDRGKWDADVVEEADAPLVAVEAVVRGVQRRAGDASEPDRLGNDAVARILAGEVGPA